MSGIETLGEVNTRNIQEAVDKKFHDKVEELKICILPTPHEDLNLKEIQSLSIRREGVFESLRKNIDGTEIEVGEKGFRDYLILKTIEKLLKAYSGSDQIAVLTNDGRLKDSIEAISNSKIKFEIYRDNQSTLSLLNSLKQDTDSLWIAQLLPIASDQFFDNAEKTGPWFSHVKDRILKQFDSEIRAETPAALFGSNWTLRNKSFTIANPQYEKSTNNIYTWVTRINLKLKFTRPDPMHFAKQSLVSSFGQSDVGSWPYTRGVSDSSILSAQGSTSITGYDVPGSITLGQAMLPHEEADRLLAFQVYWESKVSEEAEFSEIKLLEIKPAGLNDIDAE